MQTGPYTEIFRIDDIEARQFLYRRFERYAKQSPERIAVVCGGESISYHDLNIRANRAAFELIELGVGPDVLVGLCMPPSIDLIAGMLAIMKAGGAFVALDPDYPAARIHAILAKALPGVVLASDKLPEHLGEQLENDCCELLYLNSTDAGASADTDANPQVDIAATSLCYVMFTSGSTGMPNGVMVSHANLALLFENIQDELEFSEQDNWSALHSFGFGFSVWEIWGALSTGAQLTVIPASMRADPAAWCRLLAGSHVTVLSITPSGFRQLLHADCLPAHNGLPDLRLVVFSGEAVHTADIDEWYRVAEASQARLINTYALTETAGRMTMLEYRRGQTVSRTSIGKPVSDAQIFILDPETGLEVSPGATGELHLGGPMIALGYLGDDELTAEQFCEFADADGTNRRFYCSGDLACINIEGEIEFAGRTDDQVKIRGHRVELGEIEMQLRQHPGIRDAAVVVRKSRNSQSLAAFVVPAARDANRVEFWPSLGEYQVYDSLLYDFMASDELRVVSYRRAFEQHVAGKVVLDIGTGKDAVLARMCAASGARKVYAVEVLPDAAAAADELVRWLGLGDRIEVICGDMQTVELPEPVEVCTQGIIGNIGSSDGIVPIWNDARRLFAESFTAIPEVCTTFIAPAQLPDDAREAPRFDGLAKRYADAIFEQAGRTFDVRLCVRNFPADGLLTEPAVFEQLDFRGELGDGYTGEATFTLTRDGLFDGFILWTRIGSDDDASVDFLEHQQAWLPVWLPLCDEPITLSAGSTISACWMCATPDADIYPDYEIEVEVVPGDMSPIRLGYTTRHHETALNRTALHRSLLSNAAIPQPQPGDLDFAGWLATRLPAYMVPAHWKTLEQLPLNASGKLDRTALQDEFEGYTEQQPAVAANTLESDIAAIWGNVLEREVLNLDEDFFAAGGDSILAVRLTTEVQRYLDDMVFLAALFDAPTVRLYAAWLQAHHPEAVARRVGERPAERIPVTAAGSGPVPLSHAQQSLWFLQQLYPGNTGANEQFMIRMKGAFDQQRFAGAWRSLLSRHDVLRSYISGSMEQPVQQVASLDKLGELTDPAVVRLESGTPEDAAQELVDSAAIQIAIPFVLEHAPLLRAVLYTIPGDETVLLVTVHHIIADGLCVALIRDELAAEYAGTAAARPALQFADFAYRERAGMQLEDADRELDWWRNRLAGHDGFPAGGSTGVTEYTGREVRVPFALDALATDSLRVLARDTGATPFMLLLAAWRTWLTRCLGNEDLLVGSPATLRRDADTRRMLGCMVNNVIYRNPVNRDSSFRELLLAERENALTVYDHSTLPFERIVEALVPERLYGRHPLFQIMFMFEDRGDPAVTAGGLEFRCDVPVVDRAGYWDLELSVTDHGAGKIFSGFLGIREDIYDIEALTWWAEGLAAMLEAIALDPDAPVGTLPLHSDAQLRRQLVDWNATLMPVPEQTLHGLFQQQARGTPGDTAVADAVEAITYKELDERADRYARALTACGTGRGDLVGVSLERSADTVAWLLAILKCGAAWLPLDPNYPLARIQTMITDARPQRILVDDSSVLGGLDIAVPVAGLRTSATLSVTESRFYSEPGDTAWILYTSGSTGVPKGARGTHAAAVNRCIWMWKEFGFDANAIFAQRTSLNFVDSVWEIFGALLHGARVEVLPAALEANPPAIADWLGERQITHLVAVPSLLASLMEAGADKLHKAPLHSLISSGEALTIELAALIHRRWPHCRLLNTYGTTETWDASCYEVPGDLPDNRRVPVGTPVANARVYVLDEAGQPVPPGVEGELCVGGLALTDGYLNQPEINQQKFVPDRYAAETGARMYRTGDRALFRGDGNIELLGRTDRQIKLRGLRVEAGDIESQAMLYSDVARCALVIRDAHDGADWLCLYVVWHERAEGDAAALRVHLQKQLPRAMVPAEIRELESLPLLPNGKLDVSALPASVPPQVDETTYLAPRTELEQQLEYIWAEALGLEKVGIRDDFFALRGHSLLATRVIARLCEELEIDVPLQALFEFPTVEGLARQVEALRWAMQGDTPGSGTDRDVVRL
ncbi:MAG: amino acid adenylation domain-containing protein [Gammaproteobacteria bacterium]|nr:amino acid adenylation domain-containing protein [Gammaproteobacteria bacterium]